MIKMSLAHAAHLLGASEKLADGEFTGISIDTRTLKPGNLFIAIPGANVDGHNYIEDARQRGAAAALISRPVETNLPILLVDDVVDAMGKLGAYWRNQFDIPTIAVTGSNGKTTLKNMISTIMTAACSGNEGHVLSTIGTLNNHLGLPLTLARLDAGHRYAVIEMGMNHFGEIEYLTKLTRPTIAVITNAAAAHLEGVGDLAGVARAKAEIFRGLQPNGTAILNSDDPYFDYWRGQVGAHQIISFGFSNNADVSAAVKEGEHVQHIALQTPKGNVNIILPLLGKHNALNALAATAAALAAHVDLDAIKRGLENMMPAPGRLQLHTLLNGVKIIDDTYNANPFSLQAAVETLATFKGKRILVLGDMKELGDDAKQLHYSAGETVRQAGIDFLFTYGELSADTAKGFGEGAYHFTEQEKLVSALKPFLQNNTTILIKGSRSMKMEKVVQQLTA
jgi:UDP-N-acetylmuramoyl-tripeptide--D-alanyl-D-alanine ligase